MNFINNEDGDSTDSEGEIEEDEIDYSEEDDDENDEEEDSDGDELNSDENEEEEEEEDDDEIQELEDNAPVINESGDGKTEKTEKFTQLEDDNKKVDEYEYDTSDEEDIRNTVGNVPKKWYDEYRHLGYDWDGKKILKPETGDQLDSFLKRMEDPDFWRTVKDPQTGQDVVLSPEDIQVIRRIQAQKIPDVSFDEYAVSLISKLFL